MIHQWHAAHSKIAPTTAEPLSPAGMFDHVHTHTEAIHSNTQCSTVQRPTERFILKMAVLESLATSWTALVYIRDPTLVYVDSG